MSPFSTSAPNPFTFDITHAFALLIPFHSPCTRFFPTSLIFAIPPDTAPTAIDASFDAFCFAVDHFSFIDVTAFPNPAFVFWTILSSFPPVSLFIASYCDDWICFAVSIVAATIPLIPPPCSLYALFIFPSFSLAVLTDFVIYFCMPSCASENTFDANFPILLFLMSFPISRNFFFVASLAFVTDSMTFFFIFPNASLICFRSFVTVSLTLSQFLINKTIAAMIAVMIATTPMVPSIFIAVPNAVVATVADVVAAV